MKLLRIEEDRCVLVQLSEQENDAGDLAEALEAVVVGNHVEPKASYCNKKHSEEDSGCSNWCSKGTGVVLAQFETWTWNNVIHKARA